MLVFSFFVEAVEMSCSVDINIRQREYKFLLREMLRVKVGLVSSETSLTCINVPSLANGLCPEHIE